MSSIPSSIPRSASDRWLALEVAAQRSGMNIGSIRRLCGERFLAQGTAVSVSAGQIRPDTRQPHKGKPTWLVREDADPRFAIVASVEKLDDQFDFRPFTEEQRRILTVRRDIVAAWHEWRGDGESFLADVRVRHNLKLSARALQYWYASWRANGVAGLVDERWSARRDGSDRFAFFYERLTHWYKEEGEATIRSCYKLARAECRRQDHPFPTVRSASRFLADLRRKHAPAIVHARKGPTAFDNQCAAYNQRDYTKIRIDGAIRDMWANDIWCGDHHPCDCIVRYKDRLIRPWMSAFEDIRSRRIFFAFTATPPNTFTVLLALRAGIVSTDLAIPRIVYVDNGKDYDAYTLQGKTKAERRWGYQRIRVVHDAGEFGGILGTLGIKTIHAIPFNAKGKPVERFFRTFEDGFGKLQRTYCGNTPHNKPECLADRLDEAPEFADYVDAASAWVEDCYNRGHEHSGHGMDGRTPIEVYNQTLAQKRTVAACNLDLLLMPLSRPVTVGRNGVHWDRRLYGQGEPALQPYFGQKVRLAVDPANIVQAQARSLDGVPIADLRCNELSIWGELDDATWQEAEKKRKRHNRQLKEVRSRGMRMVQSAAEILLEDARSQAGAPTPPPQPSSIVAVRTPFDGVQKPLQSIVKLAAGAEGMSCLLDDVDDLPAAPIAAGGSLLSLIEEES